MSSTADIDTLRVVNPSTAHFGPMQAFYLQTGEDDRPSCSSVPNNGLMIQTSEGVAEVNLWINEVKIRLGSTAFITAQRNRQMTISMLEGTSHVEAMGVEYTAAAGSALTIPLDHNLAPAAPPNPPVPITDSDLQNLPVTILDRPITIPTIAPTATLTETPVPTIVTSSPTIEATSAFGPTSTSTLVTLTAEVTEEPSTATPEQTEAVDTPTLTFVPTETETPTETIELTAEMTAIPNAIETPIETIEPTATPTHTVTPAPTATGV
jgi:hypothetical protein